VLLAVVFLSGCVTRKSTSGYNPQAPVEDRTKRAAAPNSPLITPSTIGPSAAAQSANGAKALAGIENAGKPGYYTVKSGDTLIRIGLDNGQNWRDIARWNQLDRPSQIEIGQVLRISPPLPAPAGVAVVPAPAIAPVSVSMPVPMPGVAVVAPSPVAAASAPVAATKAAAPAEELNWMWPTTSGIVLAGFDEAKNKGLDLGGKAGDAVLAAMDGRVVYAGSGLRGYGNLIILKHNDIFLSAYAHNQTLLVKEDQSVVKGQRIAEMGQSDTDRVKLHFEIRKQGKPVDPAQYLPKR
jgi:lipoprotein NlpD